MSADERDEQSPTDEVTARSPRQRPERDIRGTDIPSNVSAHGNGERCPNCAPKTERSRERPARDVNMDGWIPPSVRSVRAMRNRRRVIE